ncbi:MAG: hypothetical protein U9R26_05545 [Campylobacterota bacterium]|nr:hypothetical protein [Campylobacterota bacterium]
MKMRFINYGLLAVLSSSLLTAASVRSQVSLIEASENIRLESQEIVKNYLYFYGNHKKAHEKELAEKGLESLDKQFRLIAKSTKDEDSKDILAFLDYSKEKMQEVLDDPFNKDNPALMLDYSEILLEGAESISKNLNYTPTLEEMMLIRMKDISFLIERMTKYYMAILTEDDSEVYAEGLADSIQKMENDLASLSDYDYSSENNSHLDLLKSNWSALKGFYTNYKTLKLPNIVLLASNEVKKSALILEIYHSKNQ